MNADGEIFDDERLSAWLDGELDVAELAEVDALRHADPGWSRALDELAETRTLVRGLAVAEPPPGFLESLHSGVSKEASGRPVDAGIDTQATAGEVVDLDAARSRRRRRRATVGFASAAAAAAILVAVLVPGVARTHPALATDIRVHQAGVASSGDPISGLAPLGTSMRFGR